MTKKRPALFPGRRFDDVITLPCVLWRLRYSLSCRSLAGITRHPDQSVDATDGTECDQGGVGVPGPATVRNMIATPKFCSQFRALLAAGGIERLNSRRAVPNLNSHAERWVRSVKGECLSKLILFGETSLRRALTEFIDHFHFESNHQGKGNVLLFPSAKVDRQKPRNRIRCRERLAGY